MEYNYTEESERFQNIFDLKSDSLQWDHCINIENRDFTSTYNHYGTEEDRPIQENNQFRYIRFVPNCRRPFDKAILLLHGLNERDWLKYLPWARFLSSTLSRPVILFPLAHHMNRSPEAWLDRKQLLLRFKRRPDKAERSTFANTILSERLTSKPDRFFRSGMQTYRDIVKLVKELKREQELFHLATQFDILGYSIGAFLGELLLMLDPENLFTDSKLFLFCGGSVLDRMNPLSKSILDSKAVKALLSFSQKVLKPRSEGKISESWKDICSEEELLFFQSMLSMDSFSRERDQRLKEIGDRIKGISLKQDKVIPADAVHDIFHERVEIRDFPYLYKHEAPFPLFKKGFDQVNREFNQVFESASAHFD